MNIRVIGKSMILYTISAETPMDNIMWVSTSPYVNFKTVNSSLDMLKYPQQRMK